MPNVSFLGGSLFYSKDGNTGDPAIGFQEVGKTSQLLLGEPFITRVVHFVNNREKVTAELTLNSALATTGISFFTAKDKSYAVQSIEEIHTVAEAAAATANLKIERANGTEAVEAGDDLLAATDIDLKATVNTLQTGTVLTASGINVLAAGDRLLAHAALDDANAVATAEFVGSVTVKLLGVADAMQAAVGFEASDKGYRLLTVDAMWGTAESTASECNLDVIKLATTKAPDAARATGIEDVIVTTGATQIDLTGTIDTVEAGTLVTAASEQLFAAGDRLAIRFSDDAGVVVTPTELDDLCVVLRFAPRTMTAIS